jgi:hypothetical protein
MHLPDFASHSLIDLSRLPLARKSRTKWGAITVASDLDSSWSPFLRVVAAALLLLRSSFIYYMRSAVVILALCYITAYGLSSSSSPSSPSINVALDSSVPFYIWEKLPPEYSDSSIVLAASRGAQARQSIQCSCSLRMFTIGSALFVYYWSTVSVFQMIIDSSLLEVAKRLPEVFTATRLTQSVCPLVSYARQSPDTLSQSFIV